MGSRSKSKASNAARRSAAKRRVFLRDVFHKRLPDFEAFDRIELRVVPRLKQSGISGDEWRHSVVTSFYFKGRLIAQEPASRMLYAIMLLGQRYLKLQEPISDEHVELIRECCDNVGCESSVVEKYQLLKEFSPEGDELVDEHSFVQFRHFCETHRERGNASREDNDENYVPLKVADGAPSEVRSPEKKVSKRR